MAEAFGYLTPEEKAPGNCASILDALPDPRHRFEAINDWRDVPTAIRRPDRRRILHIRPKRSPTPLQPVDNTKLICLARLLHRIPRGRWAGVPGHMVGKIGLEDEDDRVGRDGHLGSSSGFPALLA